MPTADCRTGFLIEEPDTPAIDVPSEKILRCRHPIRRFHPSVHPTPDHTVEVPVLNRLMSLRLSTSNRRSRQRYATACRNRQRTVRTAATGRQDTSPIAVTYPTPAEVPAVKLPPAPRRDKLTDTAKISVFDLFGLPKPSETQELKPLVLDANGDPLPVVAAETSAAVQSPATPQTVVPSGVEGTNGKIVSEARRSGRRALMRRKFVKVRLPMIKNAPCAGAFHVGE